MKKAGGFIPGIRPGKPTIRLPERNSEVYYLIGAVAD